ncbi:MAG: proton-conducting transporter membrane subunit [Ignavibacteriaceae bacterium]|nr:proton-conducting transporter membrane subunit [Ignavibacteriaceae bacterium]
MRNKIYEIALIIITIGIAASTSIIASYALVGRQIEIILSGNQIFGQIPLRIDSLSAWMILIINFTFITGVLYGTGYLKHYNDKIKELRLHQFMFVILHFSMILVCTVQNFIAFLIVWEIMTGSAFLLIIFEYWNKATVKAGLNYFIQSHVGVVFILVSFIWIIAQTGSTDFNAVTAFSQHLPVAVSITLFVLLFIGFGFKAGFVPLHTWLPYAHPSAPSHISGMMSGVIIKLGIYGILRMLLLIKTGYLVIGEIILFVSIVSGLYGVILAIVQHNLKKLLAYHSIENIGIIGIGIGIGTIGLGLNNDFLAIAGFCGGLLHILNHSLFKSLLFYGAGSVYQQTGTLDIEKLGGLIKRMPQTAGLFLIAALAICGLPPLNGFISEFLIFSGLFSSLKSGSLSFSLYMLTAVAALVTIGGLAILCFTKAFGIVFLGNERSHYNKIPEEVNFIMLLPKYMAAAMIFAIGLFPRLFLELLKNPVSLFVPNILNGSYGYYSNQAAILTKIGLIGMLLISVIFILFGIKKYFERYKVVAAEPTWGCGYVAPDSKMQYTASSFVKTYSNLIEPALSIHKSDVEMDNVFPGKKEYSTHNYDKLEFYVIDKNLKWLRKILLKLNFLQNGRIQFYILYGVLFVLMIILISYGEYLWQVFTGFYKLFSIN